jgi:hypothetical protein
MGPCAGVDYDSPFVLSHSRLQHIYHVHWATLCQSRLYPPVRYLDLASVHVVVRRNSGIKRIHSIWSYTNYFPSVTVILCLTCFKEELIFSDINLNVFAWDRNMRSAFRYYMDNMNEIFQSTFPRCCLVDKKNLAKNCLRSS